MTNIKCTWHLKVFKNKSPNKWSLNTKYNLLIKYQDNSYLYIFSHLHCFVKNLILWIFIYWTFWNHFISKFNFFFKLSTVDFLWSRLLFDHKKHLATHFQKVKFFILFTSTLLRTKPSTTVNQIRGSVLNITWSKSGKTTYLLQKRGIDPITT